MSKLLISMKLQFIFAKHYGDEWVRKNTLTVSPALPVIGDHFEGIPKKLVDTLARTTIAVYFEPITKEALNE